MCRIHTGCTHKEGWSNQVRNCEENCELSSARRLNKHGKQTSNTLWEANETTVKLSSALPLYKDKKTNEQMSKCTRNNQQTVQGRKQQIDFMHARYSCCLTGITSEPGTSVAASNFTVRSARSWFCWSNSDTIQSLWKGCVPANIV